MHPRYAWRSRSAKSLAAMDAYAVWHDTGIQGPGQVPEKILHIPSCPERWQEKCDWLPCSSAATAHTE